MRISSVAILVVGAGAGLIACGSSGVGESLLANGDGPAKAIPSHDDAGKGTDGGGDASHGGAASSSSGGSSEGDSSAADSGTTPFTDTATFTLIDAKTGTPIPGFDPMVDGAKIDLGTVGTSLSILAQPPPVTVGCLAFALDATFTYTADTAPYSLCGSNTQGGYNPCSLTIGPHTLTVTAYPQPDLGGEPYQPPTTLQFTVVDSAADAGTD